MIVDHEGLIDAAEYWVQAEDRMVDMLLRRFWPQPLNLIVHSIEDINHQLERGRYFFTDIVKDGIALFEEPAVVTDKRDVLAALEKSATYLLEAVGSLSDAQMGETIRMFGQEGVLQASLLLVVGDMHEHLGQAIAYARMNKVVPPWTARQGQ